LIVILVIIVLFIFLFSGKNGLQNAMMGSYNRIRKDYPYESEFFYMKESLRMRFRSWPTYKLESFVSDCENIQQLIEKIRFYESKGVI